MRKRSTIIVRIRLLNYIYNSNFEKSARVVRGRRRERGTYGGLMGFMMGVLDVGGLRE